MITTTQAPATITEKYQVEIKTLVNHPEGKTTSTYYGLTAEEAQAKIMDLWSNENARNSGVIDYEIKAKIENVNF